MFSHRIHRTHRTFLLGYSPTDFTDLHRIFLLGYSPTDFTHRSYGAFKGVHLSQVHQHNKIYILPQNSEHILVGIFSHRFHRTHRTFLLRKLPQISHTEVMVLSRGCTCLKCTNTTKSIFSHRIQNTFLLGFSPTDFTDLHRIFC